TTVTAAKLYRPQQATSNSPVLTGQPDSNRSLSSKLALALHAGLERYLLINIPFKRLSTDLTAPVCRPRELPHCRRCTRS
uniref:Uncharacterized protein n=1 Tax=Ciona savignyi TaxID=51511 RepID=H2YLZ3_CIOSA